MRNRTKRDGLTDIHLYDIFPFLAPSSTLLYSTLLYSTLVYCYTKDLEIFPSSYSSFFLVLFSPHIGEFLFLFSLTIQSFSSYCFTLITIQSTKLFPRLLLLLLHLVLLLLLEFQISIETWFSFH